MRFTYFALSVGMLVITHQSANAGLFLLDFCATTDEARCLGSAEDWDALIDAKPDEVFELTDWSTAGDNDVTMTLVRNDDEGLLDMWPNFTGPPEEGSEYNGIDVPLEAAADYWYRNPDTAGLSALMRFDNLDAGQYEVTLFEGRVTDGFQEGKVWVGDEDGSNEPDEPNTDNFALMEFKTVGVSVVDGDSLFYRHLEDGTGGISGMIIQSVGDPCDLNQDGVCDALDIDVMTQRVLDGTATQAERTAFIEGPGPDGLNTYVGDTDFNLQYDEQDIVEAFIEGKYLLDEKAVFAQGDSDGDFRFTEQDIVAAFTRGGYLAGPRGAVSAVPEPSSLVLLALGLLPVIRRRR